VSNISVESVLSEAPSVVAALRREPFPPMTFLPMEFSNWQLEQRSWRDAAAFLDQSHHMVDLFVDGPDALKLFSDLGVNSFANFTPGKAKQFVAVAADGNLISDAILFHLADGGFDLVGLPIAARWVQFHAETGGYDVTLEWDDNSFLRKGAPKLYRYEVQGPAALDVVNASVDEPIADLRFFQMGEFVIAGRRVQVLKHGMAGASGFEFFGPWEDGEAVRDALFRGGEQFGLRRVGYRAYSTLTLESAWISLPVAAIYTGEAEKTYREWLPAAGNLGSLAGSFDSQDIRDYYVSPADIGYGKVVRFDHDFYGRDALEARQGEESKTKVTLSWNGDDVADIFREQFAGPGDVLPPRLMTLPKDRAARYTYDAVLGADGGNVGFSLDTGYLGPDRRVLSLAMVDAAHAEPGTEVLVKWGEPEGSTRPDLVPHRQVEIRATVLPAPYSDYARDTYRKA